MPVAEPDYAGELEVAITHKLDDAAAVRTLWDNRWIAVDFGRHGADPSCYHGRGKSQVKLFNRMATVGAAVVGIYRKASPNPSDRLIGFVRPGSPFLDLNSLLCLQLAEAKVVDASANFVGNLVPRLCTVQVCHKKAVGRLSDLAHGRTSRRDVAGLHHLDVEWLVTNYLVQAGLAVTVWSGGRSFADIDHAGFGTDGRTLLGQTTVSAGLVGRKAERLLALARPDRTLYLFAPAATAGACPAGITFVSLERVFGHLDATEAGRWLIDQMLTAGG